MKKWTADIIITNDGQPLRDHIITLSDSGKIITIAPDHGESGVSRLSGIIVPGYINAHCHLELSHLKGIIPTGTGLVPFIKGILQLRAFPQDEIIAAIMKGDQEMWENGIVAVGDISNKTDTVDVKQRSPIRYHTFVEMFDLFQPGMTQGAIESYTAVYNEHSAERGNRKSYVPHAPYSVSDAIYEYINSANSADSTVSIHNQELVAENELFQFKTGEMLKFYQMIGMDLEAFAPSGTNSIDYAIQRMDPAQRSLFVHNTISEERDIQVAQDWSPHTFWATCPNANLYIENKLPHYDAFVKMGAKMCIGTDSLSSNWGLSIYEEMKTIKKYQSYVSDMDIIRWATVHGAEALGYDDLGRLKVGTTPGLNHIDVSVRDGIFDLNNATKSTKLA